MFHIVLCLLMDLKEDGEGGFSWDLGGVWSLSLPLLWILWGSPGNICWQGRPLFPALARSPLLLFSFRPFKKERYLNPHPYPDMIRVTWDLKPPCAVLVPLPWLCLVSCLLPLGQTELLSTTCLPLPPLSFFFRYMWPLLLTELENWSCSMLAALQWNLLLQTRGISKPALLSLFCCCHS